MDNLSDLKRKLWITRKSRIQASERILKKYNVYQGVQIYYSIVIVIYSIWNIQPVNTNGRITEAALFLMIVSVIFSLFSLFVSTKNLQEKFFNLKINYIELEKLYGQLSVLKAENVHEITNIRNHYNNLLSAVDNHETIDYYRIILNDSEEINKLNEEQVDRYKKAISKAEIYDKLYQLLLYLMPILLPIIIKSLVITMSYFFPSN